MVQAGVNYINTTTLETNLTTEMTSSSAKKLNVSENKKRLKKVKAANELFLKLLESSQNYVISDIQVVNDILKKKKHLTLLTIRKNLKFIFKINNNIKDFFLFYYLYNIINN
jgi:formiminotetrahydrofolate cyclodeaminase